MLHFSARRQATAASQWPSHPLAELTLWLALLQNMLPEIRVSLDNLWRAAQQVARSMSAGSVPRLGSPVDGLSPPRKQKWMSLAFSSC
jgi:hypothetical protein